jgi:hypothetical protein
MIFSQLLTVRILGLRHIKSSRIFKSSTIKIELNDFTIVIYSGYLVSIFEFMFRFSQEFYRLKPMQFKIRKATFFSSTILFIANASRSRSQLLQRQHQQNNKRLTSIGGKTFTETMIESLNGEKPGHHTTVTTYRYARKDSLRSLANDRAREGFRYWVLEKPVHKGLL